MMGGMGGMGGGILGGAIGQTGNQLGQAFQSIVATAASAKESAKAREWAEKLITHTPSWRIQGLKAAGLNPILAAGASYAGTPTAGMMQRGGASSPGGRMDITAAQQLKNLKTEGDILNSRALQERYRAQAAQWDPLRAIAALTSEEWSAKSAEHTARLRESMLPAARGQARFYGHPAGETLQRWNLIMRNIFGAGPKPMPIYRGK